MKTFSRWKARGRPTRRRSAFIRFPAPATGSSGTYRSKLLAFGQGACGAPLLHAAVLDNRIGRVIVQDTLASYRTAVDRPIHRNLYDVAIPGVLRKYDVADIASALKVTFINPVDALGKPARLNVRAEFRGRRDSLIPLLGFDQLDQ